MERDTAYEGQYHDMRAKMNEELRESIYGWGKGGWWEKPVFGTPANDGNGSRWRRAREGFDVRYPRIRKERDRARRAVKREGLRLLVLTFFYFWRCT